jgi:hypothetical protein
MLRSFLLLDSTGPGPVGTSTTPTATGAFTLAAALHRLVLVTLGCRTLSLLITVEQAVLQHSRPVRRPVPENRYPPFMEPCTFKPRPIQPML